MQSDDAREIGNRLAQWSQPIIADRAMESYQHFTADMPVAQALCGHHCRMWRHLILDEARAALISRRELLRLGKLVAMSSGAVDAIDRAILDELLDCVFARFHNSRTIASAHARSLMLAAGWLVEVRLAA